MEYGSWSKRYSDEIFPSSTLILIYSNEFIGANNQLKENADKFYSKDEDLLLGMEDMASSVTEDDNSQMQSQSSLQDIQPMDSSEEIL